MKSIDIHTHIQVRNILFAADFSHAASATAPYIASLAKRYGTKLYALHVRPPIINPMTPPETWPQLEEAAEVVAERQRQQLLGTFPGIQLEVLIKEGDLWSNLRDAVEDNKIDLIVRNARTVRNQQVPAGFFSRRDPSKSAQPGVDHWTALSGGIEA